MIELSSLDIADAKLVQLGLIAAGHLRVTGEPKGIPGPATAAAYEDYRAQADTRHDRSGGDADKFATEILRVASRFVGLKEVKPNAKWDNPSTPGSDAALSDELRALMRPSPWQDGWAYCAAFVEGVVAQALRNLGYSEKQVQNWADVMSPHCVTASRNFESKRILRQSPVRGAIWLARHGSGSSGHCGIVRALNGATMATTEANTSAGADVPAKEREGDWIADRVRNVGQNGSLTTLGFVHPADILKLVG